MSLKVRGNNFPVIAYISPDMFQKLEYLRGDIARSRFLMRIIENAINAECEKKELE